MVEAQRSAATAPDCLRCGRRATVTDAIGTPFCGSCARHQETAAPDLLPLPPITEAENA